jgi:hypothetical protein
MSLSVPFLVQEMGLRFTIPRSSNLLLSKKSIRSDSSLKAVKAAHPQCKKSNTHQSHANIKSGAWLFPATFVDCSSVGLWVRRCNRAVPRLVFTRAGWAGWIHNNRAGRWKHVFWGSCAWSTKWILKYNTVPKRCEDDSEGERGLHFRNFLAEEKINKFSWR